MRARQIERRDKDTEEARLHIRNVIKSYLRKSCSCVSHCWMKACSGSLVGSQSLSNQFRLFGPFGIRRPIIMDHIYLKSWTELVHGHRLKVYFSCAEDEVDDEEMLTVRDESTGVVET